MDCHKCHLISSIVIKCYFDGCDLLLNCYTCNFFNVRWDVIFWMDMHYGWMIDGSMLGEDELVVQTKIEIIML